MSDGEPSQAHGPALNLDATTFRAMLRRKWVQSGVIQSGAFIRAPKDIYGLCLGHGCSPHEYVTRFSSHFGVGHLKVEAIKSIDGLEVVADLQDDDHAIILGVPFSADNALLAEQIAGALAERATFDPVRA